MLIPETDIFITDGTEVITNIYEATDGNGVDAIVGAISGTDIGLSACLAECGRLVDTTLLAPSHWDSGPAVKGLPTNNTSSSVNLMDIVHKKPALAGRTFKKAMKLAFDQGLRPPQPLQSFSANEVKNAFSQFQDRESFGKRVLVLDPNTPISVSLQRLQEHAPSVLLALLPCANLDSIGQR